ncbi:hypothetical protein K2173_020467 [Erythroxylum novogranatense]|uniref:Uncharacterized protein n=1 Tax=Erythroxylum novogranatense TaxID=1862640 RepID=A0AAV8TGM0_9ROSI|nr:hypothetical protein K2173_020467 [Erythroxylum novogranatense]
MSTKLSITYFSLLLVLTLLRLPLSVNGECKCTCDKDAGDDETGKHERSEALKYKVVAIVSILVASTLGVLIPIVGKKFPCLKPESNIFFLIKAFAAGVILSTGFVHILPDAYENLTNPCLSKNPWQKFPFTGLIAMLSAILTMTIDAFATSYYTRTHLINKATPENDDDHYQGDVELRGQHEGHLHVHTHATHGHAHGGIFASDGSNQTQSSDLFRHRIVSQVLELGIVVHSVIIGISLGTNDSTEAVKPLVAALTFHQFFEGMGLGGCISQANFKYRDIAVMVLFFSLTTPVAIGIGMVISHANDENSTKALVVEGVFNAAAAGILIYMALVDLLAEDFMNPVMQGNLRLQFGATISLLLGTACMSSLAKWA